MRKVFTGLVVVLAALLIAGAMGIHTVRQSVLQPTFYDKHFAQVDTYQTLGKSVAPRIVRQRARQFMGPLPGSINAEITSLVATTLSNELLSQLTTQALTEILNALHDPSAPLQITVPTERLLRALGEAIQGRLHKSALFQKLYDRVTETVAHSLGAHSGRLPFSLKTTRKHINQAICEVVFIEWVVKQLANQIPGGIDFLVGRTKTLNLKIKLQSRSEALQKTLQQLIAKADLTPFVLDRIVRPAVCERLGGRTLVVTGNIRLTDVEIASVFHDVLTSKWGRARRQDVTRVLAEWLTGQRENLALSVPLAPLKKLAVDRLTALVLQKVNKYLQQQPECMAADVQAITEGVKDPLACRPPAHFASAHKPLLEVAIRKGVHQAIQSEVPDVWPFDEVAWMQTQEQRAVWQLVQRSRQALLGGVTINEADLRRELERDRKRRDTTNILDTVLSITRGQKWASINIEEHLPRGVIGHRAHVYLIHSAWHPLLGAVGFLLALLLFVAPGDGRGKLYACGAALVGGSLLVLIVTAVAPTLLPTLPKAVHDVPLGLTTLVKSVLRTGQITAGVVGAVGLLILVGPRLTRASQQTDASSAS